MHHVINSKLLKFDSSVDNKRVYEKGLEYVCMFLIITENYNLII